VSMPPDYVLQQYQGAAVGVIYNMLGDPYQPVQIEDGRTVQFWQIEATKLHYLRLQIEALRAVGVI
jgi:hypothetical protein